jgi:beta-glucuronidase
VDHGLVDENRQRRPSYYVWQQLNAPAHAHLEWQYNPERQPVGFRASIERRRPDEIPTYALRNYRVEWEVRDDNNNKLAGATKELPEIGAAQSLDSQWPAPTTKSLRLMIRLYRPTGFVALEQTLRWWDPRTGGLNVEEMKRQGMTIPQ